jgi:hypothetical protein
MQLSTLPEDNYEQLKAKRIALMAKHNNLTRELLALDVQLNKLKPRKTIR